MGGMLTQPVTQKKSEQGEGLGLKYGLSSMQGWRPEMEDAHDVKLGLKYGLGDWSFFAVFDGHAGKRAAAFAACNLLEYILRDSQFELSHDNSLEPAYIEPPDENLKDELGQTFSQIIANHSKSSNKSNGEDKSPEAKIQKTISDDRISDTENSGLSKCPSQETSSNANHDDVGNKEKPDDKTEEEKPKFVLFPVLKQLDMVKNAIKSGFLRIDQSMRMTAQDMSGCTAVCTFISPTHLFIANCGDSRAVLYDGVSPKFCTEDHKPYNPKERKRIIDAGGTATQRINGTLAVSRALGDFEFKKDEHRGPYEQLVSPEPEVTVIERQPNDEFLILACDGIWDVMNNEEICKFVRYMLKIEPDLEKICSSVLDVCLRKGSRDNMSIIIVVFETGPKVCESEVRKDKENDQTLLQVADLLQKKDTSLNCFPAFLACLKNEIEQELSTILPPGAGIEAKYDLLQERYDENHVEEERCPSRGE